MQRMDSLDSSKNKILFKKRIHRPWKPALLENALEEEIDVMPGVDRYTSDALELNAGTEHIEQELQQHLDEKTKERNEINQQLTARGENRVLIGGFLYPHNIFTNDDEEKGEKTSTLMSELKSKEQEILLIAHDLKVAKALEQAEKLEISRQKEEEARKSAEEKALFAIQQAKHAAEQMYKIEQQLNLERKFRIEDEKIRKSLEDKIQKILQEVERKEQLILAEIEKREQALLREEEAKAKAEERIKSALEYASAAEQKFQDDTELEAKKAQEKIKAFQEESEKKIKAIRLEAEKKVEEAKEQAHYHEKAKLAAQNWAQKALENARLSEVAKKETEEKLANAIRRTEEIQAGFDQEKVTFYDQIRQLEEGKTTAEQDYARIAKQLTDSIKNISKLEMLVATERNLRKVQEEKLTDTQIRKDELKRKAAEDKILDLTHELGSIQLDKANADAKLVVALEDLNKYEIMMESEKTIRNSLEEKIKEFMDKIHSLDQVRQNEKDARQESERKLSVIVNKLQHLELEKAQNEEKMHRLIEHVKSLEVKLESEKYLRREAERLKLVEEQARKAAQEKITHAIEQANKTVLNVLGVYTTPESNEGI